MDTTDQKNAAFSASAIFRACSQCGHNSAVGNELHSRRNINLHSSISCSSGVEYCQSFHLTQVHLSMDVASPCEGADKIPQQEEQLQSILQE